MEQNDIVMEFSMVKKNLKEIRDGYEKLESDYKYLRTKYDNILATESGHESKTENVWQSGYAAGHEAGTEKLQKALTECENQNRENWRLSIENREFREKLKDLCDKLPTGESLNYYFAKQELKAAREVVEQEGEKNLEDWKTFTIEEVRPKVNVIQTWESEKEPIPQHTMVWVKASERLPDNDMFNDYPREYCLKCKCDGSRGAVEYKQGNYDEIKDMWQSGPYDVIWWLDESGKEVSNG